MNSMRLRDKIVVIIGGSSGVGLATARLAIQEGANVTIASRSSENLDAALDSLGGSAKAIVADISSESAVGALFAAHERIDHVFVSASTMNSGSVLGAHPDAFRRSLEERIFGVLHVVRAAAPKMPKSGSITLVSSISVDHPIPEITATTLAVSAVRQLTRCLALELAPVRVNAVSLGWIDTPLVRNLLRDQYDAVVASLSKIIPVQRIGEPAEVADAVVMLMTNGYINGAILDITGGEHLTGGLLNQQILNELA